MPEFKNKEEYDKWKASKLSQLQKESDLKKLWICPVCMSSNNISNPACKCKYVAEEELLFFFSALMTSQELYKAILNEFDVFNNTRAISLSHYLIKRFPETEEAIRLKQRIDSKTEKVVCGKCGTENIYNLEYYQKDKCDKCGEFLQQYLESSRHTRKCPICNNEISINATLCPKCGEPFVDSRPRLWSPGIAALLSFIIPGAGQIYKGHVWLGLFFFLFIGLIVIGSWVLNAEGLGIILGLTLYIACIIDAKKGDPTKEGG